MERPASQPGTESPRRAASFAELLGERGFYALIVAVAVVAWCSYYARWPGASSFEVPIAYTNGGDVLFILGVSKAFSELPAPWHLEIHHLNAPFGADWNDYPHSEKLIFYGLGLLRLLFDAGTTANLGMILNTVATCLSFAWTARRLGGSAASATAGALLFGFSPFVIGRALGHLNIAIVWHIPLLLLLIRHIAMGRALNSRRAWLGAGCLMAATSWQNPYYPAIALQLLALATLGSWLTGSRAAARSGLALLGIGAGSFFLNQLNVYLHTFSAGKNTLFTGRGLQALLTWGLRLPDLFMPHVHPLSAWSDFAMKHYFNAGNPMSENYIAFLGVCGCVLLLALAFTALRAGLRGRFDAVPWQAWVIGYVLSFALAGGLDYVLGSLGMTWLRATNRYSIVVLCAVLLWGTELIDRLASAKLRLLATVVPLALGAFELVGRRDPDLVKDLEWLGRLTASDRSFARACEAELPKNAAVFQLPVVPFPEAPSINQMVDYEHFRPYLWSTSLRFSYGAHRGREREGWQSYAEHLAPRKLVDYLEDHGFDAIVLNRRAYTDRGAALESELAGITNGRVLSAAGDLVAFKLERKGSLLPKEYSPLEIVSGFPWGWEERDNGRWAWSNGSASLRLSSALPAGKRYHVKFLAQTFAERRLDVRFGERVLCSVKLVPNTATKVEFDWSPTRDDKVLELVTDKPPVRPGGGDPREFGFGVINPTFESSVAGD